MLSALIFHRKFRTASFLLSLFDTQKKNLSPIKLYPPSLVLFEKTNSQPLANNPLAVSIH